MVRITMAAALIAAFIPAQVAYVVEQGSGYAAAKYLPSAGYPNGADSTRGPAYLPEFSNLPPIGINNPVAPVGGACIDQHTRAIYSCNGFTVQREAHPLYNEPGLTTSVGLGVYFPSNTITGMALDSDGGILYCVDDHFLIAFDKNTFAPLHSADYLYWLDQNDHISGLGYASSTDSLWACATNGEIYNMTADGDPIGPQPKSMVNSSATLNGLAVNTSNGYNSVPMPSCSFQVVGYHIMVTDGINIYDAFPNSNGPLPVNGNGTSYGLAYSSDGQLIPASSPCPLNGGFVGNPSNGGGFASISTDSAATTGDPLTLVMTGGPLNAYSVVLIDYCPIQQGGVSLPTGDTLYIWPLSLSAIQCPVMTDGFGRGELAIPAPFYGSAQAGWQWSYQWYFPDVANPTLYGCLSDAMTVTWGLR